MRALLLEAAGLRVPAAADERQTLDRARRRAVVVAVLDAAAIAVLLLLRQSERFLVLGRNEETIFALGVLVVAVHLGFRLAHAMTLATVRRLVDELAEREE